MLSLLLYHYDCLFILPLFLSGLNKFLLFTCLSKCYTEDRMSGSKQEAAICAFSSDTHIKNIEKTEREVFH